MILGHSAAAAAVIAIDGQSSVQEVAYAKLREQLLKDGQVLEATGLDLGQRVGRAPLDFAGIVIDDSQAVTTGQWTSSTASKTWIGDSYRHDGDARDGKSTARFEAKIPENGTYEVRIAYTPNNNRATNVSVEVQFGRGGTRSSRARRTINQRQPPPIDELFVSFGTFDFRADEPAVVIVSNLNADGYVIIDAVQWLRVR